MSSRGQMHGFFTMGALIPTGTAAPQEALGHIQRALGSPAAESGVGATAVGA